MRHAIALVAFQVWKDGVTFIIRDLHHKITVLDIGAAFGSLPRLHLSRIEMIFMT